MAKNKPQKLDSPKDLARVYETYTPELRGFVKRRVSSVEEAEDIVQDVFYNLARIDLLTNPIQYLSSWLYRAATNRIIDRSRKKQEQTLPETTEDREDDYFLGSMSAFFADRGDEPEEVLRNEIIRAEITRALEELPREQRSIFELTEFDGVSYKEIAASTGIPVATLLSRKHYAVAHLRKTLAAVYEDN